MADNALLELKRIYEAERDKIDWRDPYAHEDTNMLRFIHQEGYEASLEADQASAIDHSALERQVGAAPAREDPNALADRMRSEFQARFGYEPSDETVKLAAAGFKGNVYEAGGRDAFYQRVAAYDGRDASSSMTSSEAGEPYSTPGGRNLVSRASDAANRPRETENDDWLRSTTAWQHSKGLK